MVSRDFFSSLFTPANGCSRPHFPFLRSLSLWVLDFNGELFCIPSYVIQTQLLFTANSYFSLVFIFNTVFPFSMVSSIFIHSSQDFLASHSPIHSLCNGVQLFKYCAVIRSPKTFYVIRSTYF